MTIPRKYVRIPADFFLAPYPHTWAKPIHTCNGLGNDETLGFREFTGPGGRHAGEYGYNLYWHEIDEPALLAMLNDLEQTLRVRDAELTVAIQGQREILARLKEREDRLQIDPGGSDKIDELETVLQYRDARLERNEHGEDRISRQEQEIKRLQIVVGEQQERISHLTDEQPSAAKLQLPRPRGTYYRLNCGWIIDAEGPTHEIYSVRDWDTRPLQCDEAATAGVVDDLLRGKYHTLEYGRDYIIKTP